MVKKNTFKAQLNSMLELDDKTQVIGAGYAPAHITGIFEIYNSKPEPLSCGSRGVGFCIDNGVSTFVLAKKSSKQNIRIIFNGKNISGKTTKNAIKSLIDNARLEITVFSFTDLPVAQGFGISGASALSSTIALNSALKLDLKYDDLVNIAHKAEIINGTGLGDVIAQATGGVVLRTREGGFSFGVVKKIVFDQSNSQGVICVVGDELSTSNIIKNQKYIKKINLVAKKYLERFQNSPTLESFVECSYKFAFESELINKHVLKLINKIKDEHAGLASMIMLGNSLFAFGEIKPLKKICTGSKYIKKFSIASERARCVF